MQRVLRRAPRQASPEGPASPVRVFCNRSGAERDTDAERCVILIGPSVVTLRATTSSVPRWMIPRGSWCLWHRRDSHRLAPLEWDVNNQNAIKMRPGVSSHCRPSRNCQDGDLRAGTVKARRPRASAVEAKRRALHGAEHRSSMDRVMAGASAVVQIVVIFRARTRTCCFAASLLSNRRRHSALHRI